MQDLAKWLIGQTYEENLENIVWWLALKVNVLWDPQS